MASAKAFGASCGRLCPIPPFIVRCIYLPVNFLAMNSDRRVVRHRRLKSNGWHANRGTFGKLAFQIVILRFAFGQVLPPTIIMDNDSDVIRVIEGCRSAIRGITSSAI